MHPIIVEVNILEYRLELVKGNVQKSMKLLDNALDPIVKMGLTRLRKIILLRDRKLKRIKNFGK